MGDDKRQPRPLEYQPPPARRISEAGPFIAGLITGLIAIFVAGYGAAIWVQSIRKTPWAIHYWPMACPFGIIAVICFVTYFRRMHEARRHWFFMGFLLAAGALSLLEGFCFGVPSSP